MATFYYSAECCDNIQTLHRVCWVQQSGMFQQNQPLPLPKKIISVQLTNIEHPLKRKNVYWLVDKVEGWSNKQSLATVSYFFCILSQSWCRLIPRIYTYYLLCQNNISEKSNYAWIVFMMELYCSMQCILLISVTKIICNNILCISKNYTMLIVNPRINRATFGGRAFWKSGLVLWKTLLYTLRECT